MFSTTQAIWYTAIARSLCSTQPICQRIRWKCLSPPGSSSAGRRGNHRVHHRSMHTLYRHRMHLCKWSALECRIYRLRIKWKNALSKVRLACMRNCLTVFALHRFTGQKWAREWQRCAITNNVNLEVRLAFDAVSFTLLTLFWPFFVLKYFWLFGIDRMVDIELDEHTKRRDHHRRKISRTAHIPATLALLTFR